jgi:hypothetical protein
MHSQDKEICWYIDNGCSRHMAGDENKFLKLKRDKGGNVSFGDNKYDKIIGKGKVVNSNLVQYLLQTDIQKRTEKIQWQIQTLHRDFSPGNPNRENQHILYSYIVLHCLQYNIHIGASGIQNPNPMTWISPKP